MLSFAFYGRWPTAISLQVDEGDKLVPVTMFTHRYELFTASLRDPWYQSISICRSWVSIVTSSWACYWLYWYDAWMPFLGREENEIFPINRRWDSLHWRGEFCPISWFLMRDLFLWSQEDADLYCRFLCELSWYGLSNWTLDACLAMFFQIYSGSYTLT
jgi:hypothetical protein